MNKAIVVTGASGFVGANLVRKLLDYQYDVHGIIRKNSNTWRLKGVKNKIHLHEDYLGNIKKLEHLFNKFKPVAVIHLATFGGYPTQQNPYMMIDVMVRGTMNLLNASLGFPKMKIVVAGSSSEYGKKEKPMNESDYLEPNSYYGTMKAAQTYLCQTFAKTTKHPLIIFRLFSVYGPYEEKGRLVRSVIETALQKKPILLATGKEARDFIYVDDVVDAFIHALQREVEAGEVFNIGTGKQTTIKELAEKVRSLLGVHIPIKLNAYPGRSWGDTYHWKASTHKTRNKLGFRASTTINAGLLKTIEWYKTHE